MQGSEPNGDIWIFGYGSLMWRPDFPHVETRPALVRGYHRAMCVYSVRYRGTSECPGLVLGLDRGGACRGRAFKVAAADAEKVIAYLDEREMPNQVYVPTWLKTEIPGRTVSAYGFVVRRDHVQYAGKLPTEKAVELILQGHGSGGPCLDYMRNTVRHLDELGISDGQLHRVLAEVERIVERDRST